MRSFTFLSTFLLALGFVSAHPATPHRRTVETCSNINTAILFASVKACACLGRIDALIAGNSALTGVASLLGVETVRDQITDAVSFSCVVVFALS